MNWAVLGASRGLGKSLVTLLTGEGHTVFAASRDSQESMDFACEEQWPQHLQRLRSQAPEVLVYVAGGGPFGTYESKDFKDHQWAWKVSFEFPAYLLHQILKEPWPEVKRLCFVGSSVAEDQPHPKASSYAASKHALLGLVTSVAGEGPAIPVQLFSPSYLDTNMLPPNAEPRLRGAEIHSPEAAAKALYEWVSQDTAATHLRWPS